MDQDAASSASPSRENLSQAMWTAPDFGGSFRLHANICKTCVRRRCMMCPPCRQTSSRFTSCYNKSQKKYFNRKDELAVRQRRCSRQSFFSDSSVECPPLVLSLVTGGTAPVGSVGIPTRGGRTSPQAKETTPTWLEEVPSRRDQKTGNGTDHPNGWAQRQAPGQEALIRDLLRWCERQTETGTAPFGACAADVPVDATVGSAQSRVNSRRRRLAPTEEDIFTTPTGRRR